VLAGLKNAKTDYRDRSHPTSAGLGKANRTDMVRPIFARTRTTDNISTGKHA
jgi:hypothetical protein